MKKYTTCFFTLLISLSIYCQKAESSKIDNQNISNLIVQFKKDVRGPYRDIRWFCKDGSINMPKEPCDEKIGGVQRARYKEEIIKLGKENHIFLGQILATTNFDDFLDKENYYSRLKQYQFDKYLKSIDDGWINQKSQFYRGAMQAEDEEAWGKEFFTWLLKDDTIIKEQFYMLRQAIKDIPHSGDDNVAQLIRSQSKVISDEYEPFMSLRIKIHGQPEIADIQKIITFKITNKEKLTSELNKKLDELVISMGRFFKPIEFKSLTKYVSNIKNQDLKINVNSFIEANANASIERKIEASSEFMWTIRENILSEKTGKGRLALFDLSIKLEEFILKEVNNYSDDDLSSLINKICYLSMASAASGYTEIWEWQSILGDISKTQKDELSIHELNELFFAARNQLEWGAGTVRAVYNRDILVYEGFEPLIHAFIDDKIRGSIALPLGNSIGKLGDFISSESSLNNKVLTIKNQSHLRGLNSGYAYGELVVVSGSAENLDVNPNNIYIFESPPSDLKPVAGILTVSEGNLVSHVQLLARNLGIPNAAISNDNFQDFKKYFGQKVFYAVSNKGNIIMKLEDEVTEVEKELFAVKERNDEMITVPVDKIKLENTSVLNMREVNAESSGIYCGPKAANLGELKSMFPENVVEGLVIPFGIFLQHMKQNIPDKDQSYWDYLNSIFETARNMKKEGKSDQETENYQLAELEKLRGLIKTMPLLDSFKDDLEQSFKKVLGSPIGETPVFLRSDTNMEDLKDFTGAGLNLTIFNVVDKDKILEGIKSVWASPYVERSFKWRQKYLLNPENVYPSILVIPSVNNDYSGVMITKGVISGNENEITVAFSRGVGGAVDGQAAETRVIYNNGTSKLTSPAREPFYNSIPETGGLEKKTSSFETPILNEENIEDIYWFSKELKKKMGDKGIDGPYDVELGFKDNKLWLFQVRPFVENKKAKTSEYLESITPKINLNKLIPVKTKV